MTNWGYCMLLPQELIRKKRDGGELRAAEIAAFVEGVTAGHVTDGQIAALAMAVFFRDMNLMERVALTCAMRDSGHTLQWQGLGLDGPIVDKHSTGGVGDLTSLLLGPMVAACGGFVPMISGRGLGHTGGTLDKLDAIPGYNTAAGHRLFPTRGPGSRRRHHRADGPTGPGRQTHLRRA